MTYTLKFERRFSMAHRLISGKSKKCATPHGHNEFIRVYLQCHDPNALNHLDNMLINFADAKKKWHQFIDEHLDHTFQLGLADPMLAFFKDTQPELLKRIVITPGDPTTEMLCACLMSKLDHLLAGLKVNLYCSRFEIEETPTNTVILSGHQAYIPHLPQGNHWWQRDDFSINDL